MVLRIVSGGQTGVDRAALDVAIQVGIPHGGCVPKGRLAEDGPLPERYLMRETLTAIYSERTEKNVIDSDGTLILSRGELSCGSETTREMAIKHARPWLHVDLKRGRCSQVPGSQHYPCLHPREKEDGRQVDQRQPCHPRPPNHGHFEYVSNEVD